MQDPGSIQFYRVPLACEAASHIGCGIRAKPILQALESSPSVESAWLNRSGTLLAVQWMPAAVEEDHVIASAFSSEACMCADKVTDPGERRELAGALARGEGWYRSREVDQLSEEEAGIIAARVVHRLEMNTPLDADQRGRLTRSIADACLLVLVSEAPGTHASREERLRRVILEAGRQELQGMQLGALEEAMQAGNHRAMAGER